MMSLATDLYSIVYWNSAESAITIYECWVIQQLFLVLCSDHEAMIKLLHIPFCTNAHWICCYLLKLVTNVFRIPLFLCGSQMFREVNLTVIKLQALNKKCHEQQHNEFLHENPNLQMDDSSDWNDGLESEGRTIEFLTYLCTIIYIYIYIYILLYVWIAHK